MSKTLKNSSRKNSSRKNKNSCKVRLSKVSKGMKGGSKNSPALKKTTIETRETIVIKLKEFNTICKDFGVCLALGKYTNIIKHIFDNFTSFKYVESYSIVKCIGKGGCGIIHEISYIKDEYRSYAILKSNLDQDADNLMYEYNVGMFINYLNTIYPCFLETYGLYKYANKKTWEKYKDNEFDEQLEDLGKKLSTDLKIIKNIDYNEACKDPELLAILIQNLSGIKSFNGILSDGNLYDEFINNELLYSLFQVYIPLNNIREYFTHYDLHGANIQLYSPKENHYIEFHYHFTTTDILPEPTIISFKSSYITKIIDYGHSYFNFSKDFFTNANEADDSNSLDIYENQLCKAKNCNTENDLTDDYFCGEDKGFGMLHIKDEEEETYSYIRPIKKNISHDLRIIKRLKDIKLSQNYPNYEWVDNVNYRKIAGTPEMLKSGLSDNEINNIRDVAIILAEKVNNQHKIEENNTNFKGKKKLGDLHIYVDNFKPMEYIPA